MVVVVGGGWKLRWIGAPRRDICLKYYNKYSDEFFDSLDAPSAREVVEVEAEVAEWKCFL